MGEKINRQNFNNCIRLLFNSIEDYISKGKEEELREKIAQKIKSKLFSQEIIDDLNLKDLSELGLLDNSSEDLPFLFSTIFPVFVENRDVIFRLYKHKIEVDLSDNMRDRFIYIFSDGRLTSGLFKCYRLSDDEYMYVLKRIIDMIPKLQASILEALNNLDETIEHLDVKKENSKLKLSKANDNAKILLDILK